MNPEKTDLTFKTTNFIHNLIDQDNESGKWGGKVVTRFPPEPNGYLHIGHAKSICLNFGTAAKYGGRCHLRFDDTNPANEKDEFAASIQEDVRWLGYDWDKNLFYASDYFEKLYGFAEKLIERGKAYVCSLNADQMREYRGTLTQPGRPSPDRDRPVAESLKLFRGMREGEFADGLYTLRAKIDMSSPNVTMRDPALYRIKREHHHRTGDQWCIYPMYDYAHCLSDSIEGITHSVCTLEFENNRPLYDWILDELQLSWHPQQIEFARLNVSYMITSKRRLKRLVEEGHVEGWDDPRMPTIRGLRRRGFPAAALRNFCEWTGASKKETVMDVGILEEYVRDELNRDAPRAMAVLDPVKLTITNYPEGKSESLEVPVHPQDESKGKRPLTFSREIYIDRSDYMENAPKKFFRLSEGREVRLRFSYVIKCEEVIRDAAGVVQEIRCSYDPDTLGKSPADGRKVNGIIHWTDAASDTRAEIRLYDRLFTVEDPSATEKDGIDFTTHLNPDSLVALPGCPVDASLRQAKLGDRFQFERVGYFVCQSEAPKLVFSRIVDLRSTPKK